MKDFEPSAVECVLIAIALILWPWLGGWPLLVVVMILFIMRFVPLDRAVIQRLFGSYENPMPSPVVAEKVPSPPTLPLDAQQRARGLAVLERVLADMAPMEAMDLLISRLRAIHSTDPLPLAVIFDTCFLMLDKWPASWETLSSVIDQSTLKARLVVATPIQAELRKHLEGEDAQKAELARIARKRLAGLLERGVEEPGLEGIQETDSLSSIGADSSTDRRLLGYGKQLALSGQVCGVMIATDDGGIMLDAAHLYREGVHIATLTKEKKAEEILRLVRQWLVTDEFLVSMNMKW